MNCEICKIDVGIKGFSSHLRTHNINSKEYYDKYLKKENENICIKCGKNTKFNKPSKGYYKYCSLKCSANSDDIKKKKKQTNLDKYGVENPFQSEAIKEKIKQSNLEKYGVEYGLQNKEIREKQKQTNIERYGVENQSQNVKIKEKKRRLYLNKFILKINESLKYLNFELLSNYNHHRELIKIKCKKCNTTFETQYFYIQQGYGKCPNCYPKYRSIPEIEISEYITSLNLNIIKNDRSIINPYELDIYIPDKNIAIEFDGLYWHSEEHGKDKNYHLNKTTECEKNNIQLIHIFEDEWIYKKDIVKSRLKQILGLNNNLHKIHARKCEIKEISSQDKNLFLNKYHIQGEDRSNIKLGVFYENELISVMTFSHGNISKGSKNIDGFWELNRFCSNSNYNIPGIASKLLTYFIRNYEWKEIFSYADRRWSQGNVYKKIGFELEHITKPNYWYIKGLNRFHRFNLRKKPEEPKDIPEWILRQKEGYYRIWDCGHYKFIMRQ